MSWTSEVVQWLRVHLLMQGTWVQPLVREDPVCLGVTNPRCHNYWAHTLKPTNCNYWSPCALEPMLCNKRHYTSIKGLFSFSLLSAIMVVSSAYLRLLLFLPTILIPACASSAQHLQWPPLFHQNVLTCLFFFFFATHLGACWNSPSRDQTQAPFVGAWFPNTGPPGNSLFLPVLMLSSILLNPVVKSHFSVYWTINI